MLELFQPLSYSSSWSTWHSPTYNMKTVRRQSSAITYASSKKYKKPNKSELLLHHGHLQSQRPVVNRLCHFTPLNTELKK